MDDVEDANDIEVENVLMRSLLERVSFLAEDASCKSSTCMHSACSAVRTIKHELKQLLPKQRPNQVKSYQETILDLRLKLKLISETARSQ